MMNKSDADSWASVRECPDHYEVNRLGQIRNKGVYHRSFTGRVRKPRFDKKGYVIYLLCVESKYRLRYAHRLVADAFLGPIPEGMQVNHKDGDKGNPRLDNLEIVTNGENRAHAYRVLGIPPNCNGSGEDSATAKLTWNQVDTIRSLHAGGQASNSELAKQFGITPTHVARIINGTVWRNETRAKRQTSA